MATAEHIEMLLQHVAQGERHVESQREVVQRLRDLGADTELAEDILEEFEVTLAEHRRHLAQATENSGSAPVTAEEPDDPSARPEESS